MKILLIESNVASYVEMPLIEQDILGHDYHVAWLSNLDLERDKNVLSTADGIIVFEGVEVNNDLIGHLKKCKAIVMATSDLVAIDLKSVNEKGIIATYVPDIAINEIVEHTFAFILSAQRKLMLLQDCINKDNWNWRDVGAIYSSKNLTLGLVGYGKIAREIAVRAKTFGYEVIYFDPHFLTYCKDSYASSVDTLTELLGRSDIVSLHLPFNEYTHHIINKKTLSYMKKTAILINTANSNLIESAALLNAVKKRQIAQVCLDAVEVNSKIPKFFKNNPRVLITPHVASVSKQALFKLRINAVLALKRVLMKIPIQQRSDNLVDDIDQQCGAEKSYPIRCADQRTFHLSSVM